MKRNLKLSHNTTTRLGVRTTIVYAASVGLLAVLFVVSFFYFNLGKSDKAKAASVFESVADGDWSNNKTWGKALVISNDVQIIINHEVTLTKNENIKNNRVHIVVNGILNLDNGKLGLPLGSTIIINKGATVISTKGKNNDQIRIGEESWKGAEINFGGPIVLNETGIVTLPIVLAHFDASLALDNTVELTWSTYSEKNNDFFTLERSIDGKNFEVLVSIDGAGNSNKKLSYSYEDTNPVVGMNYYRLKQTDFNGDFEYFKIVGINNQLGSDKAIGNRESMHISKVWPNPFTDHVNISFEAEMEGEVEVVIQNAMGKIIHRDISRTFSGENSYVFENNAHLEAGVYYITLSQGGKNKTQRIVKI